MLSQSIMLLLHQNPHIYLNRNKFYFVWLHLFPHHTFSSYVKFFFFYFSFFCGSFDFITSCDERGVSTHSINYFGNFFISFSSAGLRGVEPRTNRRQRIVLPLNHSPNAPPDGFEPSSS